MMESRDHSERIGDDMVVRLETRDDLAAASSEWLARLERGLSPQEEHAFCEWLTARSQHASEFFAMAALWDRLDVLSRLADLFPEPVSRPRHSMRVPLAIAAMLLLSVSVVLLTGERSPAPVAPPARQFGLVTPDVFETAVGEHSTVALPDGSRLTLNTNSLARVDFRDSARVIHLERGEMHVQVAHDAARPFSVVVGETVFQAVGTEFNVEITRDHRIELIVTDGRVLVGLLEHGSSEPPRMGEADASAALALQAGQRVVLGETDETVEPIEPEEIEVKLSWRGGDLIFRGESLAEAIDEIERYTPVEFVILDEDLKKVRVAGLFKAGDVEGLLDTLQKNFNVAYQRVNDKQIQLTTQ
jgi:transmembrane sensor